MIKPDLVQTIANKTRMPKKQIELVVDTMIEVVQQEVAEGEKVMVSGFGTFYSSYRKPRNGINPVTKESIKIDGMYLPKFKPGEVFKRSLSSNK